MCPPLDVISSKRVLTPVVSSIQTVVEWTFPSASVYSFTGERIDILSSFMTTFSSLFDALMQSPICFKVIVIVSMPVFASALAMVYVGVKPKSKPLTMVFPHIVSRRQTYLLLVNSMRL